MQKASKLARTGRAPELMKGSVLKTQRTGSKDEIFVDIIEKMSCTFNPSGYLQQSQIDGSIQVCARSLTSLCLKFLLNTHERSGLSCRCC